MRLPSPGFTLFISVLALTFAVGAALHAEETPEVASGLVISQCGKTTGLILVDPHGVLHPVDPAVLQDNQSLLDTLLAKIPAGKGLTVTVACVKESGKII